MDSYREIMKDQNRSLDESYEKRDTEAKQNRIKSVSGDSSPSSHPSVQTHTHEFESSTKLADDSDDRHNHRFAGVTSEVIPITSEVIPISRFDHKHTIFTLTDFFGHLHQVAVETGPAINVGNGKHVHFVCGNSTVDDGHFHEFAFTTLINTPLLPNT